MKPLSFHTYDVFTDVPFAGNPLAIVEGAGHLTTAQMQTIAREFNLSETIFVMPPADSTNTARVRIFFPTAEIPFAGHPTIGCAIHLASQDHAGDFDTDIILEEEAGLVPVSVKRVDGKVLAEFSAPVLPDAHDGTAEPDLIAAALDIAPQDIGPHRPGIWQGGPAFLYVPVTSTAVLANARPIEPYWSQLMAQARVDSAYVYAPASDADYQARMFSPTAGIPEDPATGSASAILAAQLLHNDALPCEVQSLSLVQGVEMGRPSQINLTIERKEQSLTRVKVAGGAIKISQGTIWGPNR